MIKPDPSEYRAMLKKKKKREKAHFFKSSRNICNAGHKTATRGTSASKREATGYHTPRSLRNALSAANRLRRSVRARAFVVLSTRRYAMQNAAFTRAQEAEVASFPRGIKEETRAVGYTPADL